MRHCLTQEQSKLSTNFNIFGSTCLPSMTQVAPSSPVDNVPHARRAFTPSHEMNANGTWKLAESFNLGLTVSTRSGGAWPCFAQLPEEMDYVERYPYRGRFQELMLHLLQNVLYA